MDATPAGYVNVSGIVKDTYYFVCGVLMSSYFDYLCARQYISQSFGGEDDCLEMYLAAYSPHPVPWIMEDATKTIFIEFYSYNSILKDAELFSGAFEPFFHFKRDRYIVKNGDITWHYEYNTTTPGYKMSNEKLHLDEQILSGMISKNSVKKMIRKNLKEMYARN